MVERIVPKTPSLAKREQQAIDDIRELFPDGNVRGLDGKDKALGKRLSKLYRSLGYESRADMIEAFGFTQVDMRGRWKSVNPEELFEELTRRYEGKSKPKSLGILKHDNPDLLGKIKTVENKCSETYGHSLTVELIQRGLLDRKLPARRESLSDDEVRRAVSELEKKYSGISDKPRTVTQLKRLEPEYAQVIDLLYGGRCQALFGTTAAGYFRQVGILAGGNSQVDEAMVLSTLDALQEYYQSKDNEEKPKTMKALFNAHPEHADALKAGKKRGIVTRESLSERGILGLSKTAIAERAKQLKRRCARNGTAEELARLYCGSGGVKLVVPDDKEECLRPGVVGIDIDAGYELRETTHLLCDDDLSVGDVLHVSWEEGRGWMEGRRLRLFKDGVQVGVVSRPGSDDFLDYRSYEIDSPIARDAGTVVVKVEELGDRKLARVRHRFLTPLSRETMLYALYKTGALSESELYENDDSWRSRLEGNEVNATSISSSSSEPVVGTPKNDSPELETSQHEAQSDEAVEVAVEAKPADDGVNKDNQAIIATLKLLVLMGGMAGGIEYPQDILDELERAENGDTSVDVEDLARRMNELTPGFKSADLSNISFSQCRRARGRRFSIAIPDGWTVIKDYEESSFLGTVKRPFVAVQGDIDSSENVENRDRILYSTTNDIDVDPVYAECGTYDLKWAIMMKARYDRSDNEGVLALRPTVVWDKEVDAVNTRCFVAQIQPNAGECGLEIYVAPYALDHADFIRIVLTYDGEQSLVPARELAEAIARTLELDEPIVPACEQVLGKAMKEKVSVDEFCKMVESFAKPYVVLRQSIYRSFQYKYVTNHESYSDSDLTLAGARGIAELDNRATPMLANIVDAYDLQVSLGATADDRKAMIDSLDAFASNVYPTEEIFEDATSAQLVRSAHVFDPTKETLAVRARIEKVKEDLAACAKEESRDPVKADVAGVQVDKSKDAKTTKAKGATRESATQGSAKSQSKKRRAPALRMNDVLRVIDELCDADTFVDCDEIANALEGKPTSKRVENQLAKAYEQSKIRRVSTGQKYLYSRILTEEEWSVQLEKLNKRFEEREARAREAQRRESIAKIQATIDGKRAKIKQIAEEKENRESRLRGYYERRRDSAKRKCEELRASRNATTTEIDRIQTEISGLGFFSFMKKKQLNEELSGAQSKLESITKELAESEGTLAYAEREYGEARADVEKLEKDVAVLETQIQESKDAIARTEQEDLTPSLTAKQRRDRVADVASYWGQPVTSKWCSENVDGITARVAANDLGVMVRSGDAAKLPNRRYGIKRPMPIEFVIDQISRAAERGAVSLNSDARTSLGCIVELYDAMPSGGRSVSTEWMAEHCESIFSVGKARAVINTAIEKTGYFERTRKSLSATGYKNLYRKLERPKW